MVDSEILKALDARGPFPENELGLKRGTVLRVIHPEVVRQLGLSMDLPIPIGFDGTYVRSGQFTWSIEQLVGEITAGAWQVAGALTVETDEARAIFAVLFENFGMVDAFILTAKN